MALNGWQRWKGHTDGALDGRHSHGRVADGLPCPYSGPTAGSMVQAAGRCAIGAERVLEARWRAFLY